LVDNLDSNDTVEVGIASAIDRALATTAYLLEDLVFTDTLKHGWRGL
jgi:hypothetical protein